MLRELFVDFRSFADWWESAKSFYSDDFVEFVEEQRAKAT